MILNYEERDKIRGAKWRVHYMLSRRLNEKTTYCFLIEAKKKMDATHMAQLAHYLGTSGRTDAPEVRCDLTERQTDRQTDRQTHRRDQVL